MKYVNVIIDNRTDHTDNLYTYGCRCGGAAVGSKVRVPFAKGDRIRDAYVVSVEDEPAREIPNLKYVESIDEDVSLTPEMVRTALWMRQRYICRYIDALGCFTPVGEKAKKGVRKDPLNDRETEETPAPELTGEQSRAVRQICSSADERRSRRFLIHGVTGSGKTEIYMRMTGKVLDEGRTAIILVPEISLTAQTIDRFAGRFGSRNIAVLHSRLTKGQRYDQWKKIRRGEVKIVIGARSAVFAPVSRLGLIVVDEEHESTYKSDQTPKYDTVEVAVKRLQDRDNDGILILGSATPSVATYSRSLDGIFELVRLKERYNKVSLPEVEVVDMREELRAGNTNVLSRKLYSGMKEQLEAGRQVMILLNRRGYSTFISCRECGYVMKCPDCGLSLTYHKETGKAMCHYCGYSCGLLHRCPDCGSRYIRYFGNGTEKVEESVQELFPEYRAGRVDLDSVRKKGALKKKLDDFRKGRTQILIGTQLIAKGLDFRNVGLAGIISADSTLNIPDFRSPERAMQLIVQAAGRAGRGCEEGRVIIQTYSPEHYAVEYAAQHDYEGFFRTEIQLRRYMGYPPFSDMFQIVFTAADERSAREGAEDWHRRISAALGPGREKDLFRPQPAYMSRIKDRYRYSMLLRCEKGRRREYSDIISRIKEEDRADRKKRYTAVVDINPYSFA